MCLCYIIPKCKACCCFDLHVGAYICCASEIFYCLIDIILILTVYKYSIHNDLAFHGLKSIQPSKNLHKFNFTVNNFEFFIDTIYDIDSVPDKMKLIINTFLLLVSILLLVGIKKKNQLLVAPYLYTGFVNVIVLVGYITVRVRDDLEGWFFILQVFSLRKL